MSSSLPAALDGWGPVRPYAHDDRAPRVTAAPPRPSRASVDKRVDSLAAAFEACGLRSGQTISFHHHLRNGDAVVNAVLSLAAERGIGDLTIAPSSLFPVHAPLVEHIRSGTVRSIRTGYLRGPVADAVTAGLLRTPLILQSHGGRARAIASGELRIDVAFIGAPLADAHGAATGARGRAACGPLGYPMVDADHAVQVVVLAGELSESPLVGAEIAAERVDVVVPWPEIGDPAGILSGSTRPTTDPVQLGIADLTARAIAASGVMKDSFSFQTGAGGTSLAVADAVGRLMREAGVRGGFVSGGVTGSQVRMAREGLFREVIDVQSFDLEAVASFRDDPWHRAMSAAEYASPLHPNPIAHQLGVMILGAAEVDRDFNVNVTLGADGRILGGPGGHPDTAAGSELAIVTTQTRGGGFSKIVDRVRCLTTPGQDIDLVVTERGIAVNPRRQDLAERLRHAALPMVDIASLVEGTGAPGHDRDGRVLAALEYRDGSFLDVIRT